MIDLTRTTGQKLLFQGLYLIMYVIIIIKYYIFKIYILHTKTACVAQLAKASDTQAVGHEFEPCPDH